MQKFSMAGLATALFMASTYPSQAGPIFQFDPNGENISGQNAVTAPDKSASGSSQLNLVTMFRAQGHKRPLFGLFATPNGQVMRLDCKDLDKLQVMLILAPSNIPAANATPERMAKIKRLNDDTRKAQDLLQCPRIEV